MSNTRETAPETSAIPPGKANNGEVLFGVQDVGFLVDRDVIRVGSEIGKFDRIRLRVLKNEIFVTDLKAIFDDGTTETLLTDAKIAADRKTEWIPLKHKGFIKEIQLVYRSKPDFKGQARVEVFGEYENGWLGPNGEGRKYNDGWVLLGTDTAGSVGFDRVKIPVGQNDGGFKQLRVSVKDRDVTMTNLAVVYNDGGQGRDRDQPHQDRRRRGFRPGGAQEGRDHQGDRGDVALARARHLEARPRLRHGAGVGQALSAAASNAKRPAR